jgi:hypothetical protein
MTPGEDVLTEHQRSWLAHVQACREAGTTMRAYAAERGLNLPAFYSAKALLRRKGALEPKAQREKPCFAKARVVDGHGAGYCRIILSSGVALEVRDGTTPAWVAELVRALA